MNDHTSVLAVSGVFRKIMTLALIAFVCVIFACTKRQVSTGTDDLTGTVETDLTTDKVDDVEPKKITVTVKTRKPRSWESSGRGERTVKAVKFKSKKESSWETGTTISSFGTSGSSASKAVKKSMSLADAFEGSTRLAAPASGVVGAGASAKSSPSASRRAGRGLRSSEQQISSGILTAGSFDDADDIAVFERFWNGSELSSSSAGDYAVKNWSKSLKKADSRRHSTLQLAFVVDTTGSMGDELEYLKNEFESIVTEVNKSYPGVKKEYAFIVYRDQGDEYVTRGLNFTSKVTEVQDFISRQSANGGGDYPEAVHEALGEAYTRLDWSTKAESARMIFLIADAPAHMNEMQNTFSAVEKLADAGINIFPVAASGVMDTAEAMMRATALLTGGKYIFLTDDSGVGLPHAAPKHPCYEVEKLKNIMVRVIKDRIGGTRSFPLASNVIRHGGDRSAGLCRTDSKVVGQW